MRKPKFEPTVNETCKVCGTRHEWHFNSSGKAITHFLITDGKPQGMLGSPPAGVCDECLKATTSTKRGKKHGRMSQSKER